MPFLSRLPIRQTWTCDTCLQATWDSTVAPDSTVTELQAEANSDGWLFIEGEAWCPDCAEMYADMERAEPGTLDEATAALILAAFPAT